ncbi:MAG TPA: LamG-like jellyroll fold domain-containing protein, partial [Anaerolineae bacterium]|nr:LamG-like jellyroll fold domain-containing protein [Anaerolineae bacterium]
TTPTITDVLNSLPDEDDGTDTDGDGITDVFELLFTTSITQTDTDGDGLSDWVEIYKLGTEATAAYGYDTDGDGLSDGAEVMGFEFNGVTNYLNPLDVDTNRDQINDSVECYLVADVLTCPDTDNDNIPDIYDFDDDNDGVPDSADLSRTVMAGDPNTGFANQTFSFGVDDWTPGEPVFVDFQLRPTNPDHLWYSLSILDWPANDRDGQIQRVFTNTFGTSGSEANGDMRLVPMLQIEIPYEAGRYGNLPTINTPPPINPTSPITSWLNTTETDPFALSFRQKDDSGALFAYVPLVLVRENPNNGPVAFTGRMLYQPTLTDFGALHEAKLVWLVESYTDSCTPVADNFEPDLPDATRVEKWCEGTTNWVTNGVSIIHAYEDDWYLTGLNVEEQRGMETAVILQNPATTPTGFAENNIWTVAQGLERTFLAGRDDNDTRNFTVADIAPRFNSEGGQNSGTSDTDRWGIPTDGLIVRRFDFTHNGHLPTLATTHATALLDEFYTPNANTITNTLLLYAREERARVVTLDFTDQLNQTPVNGVVGNNLSISVDVAETVYAGLNWMPYQYQGVSTWETYPLEQYWADKESTYATIMGQIWTNPEDIDAAVLFAQTYFLSWVISQASPVEIGGQALTSAASLSDAELLAQNVNSPGLRPALTLDTGSALKITATNTTKIIAKLLGTEFFIGQPGGPFKKFTAYHTLYLNYYRNNNATTPRLGIERIAANPANTPAKVLEQWEQFDSSLKGNALLKNARIAAQLNHGLNISGAILSAGLAATNIVITLGEINNTAVNLTIKVLNVVNNIIGLGSKITDLIVKGAQQGLTAWQYMGTAANQTLKIGKASIVFTLIQLGIAVAFFIYQSVAQIVDVGWDYLGTLAFTAAIAGLLTTILVTIIFLVIASIPIVGGLIAAIIGLIDAIVAFVCALADPSEIVQEYICGGISGILAKIIQFLIFSQTPIVDMGSTDRLNITNFDIALGDPDRGFVIGNTMLITADVDTALFETPFFSDEPPFIARGIGGSEYFWQYDDYYKRDASFYYDMTGAEPATNLPDLDDIELGEMNNRWIPRNSWSVDSSWALTSSLVMRTPDVTGVAGMSQDGINEPLRLALIEHYAIPTQECWGTVIAACYLRRTPDSMVVDLGDLLRFDIFPSQVSFFRELTSRNDGSYSLAWDLEFPALQDADGDGLRSSLFGGNDPNDSTPDSDNDGLSDYFELLYGSDPLLADTDSDGLSDYEEVRYNTDPLRPDTDNDGLTDLEEITGWNILYSYDNTTPLNLKVTSDPLEANYDGDAYLDREERAYGFHPNVPDNGDILSIASAITSHNNNLVKPGDIIQYNATLTNSLNTETLRGLLDVEFPAAAAANTLDPAPFTLFPLQTIQMAGQVTVDGALTTSQAVSLTNIAGAVPDSVYTPNTGRSLWLPFESNNSNTFTDASPNGFDASCLAATCPNVNNTGFQNNSVTFQDANNDTLTINATSRDLGLNYNSYTVLAWLKPDQAPLLSRQNLLWFEHTANTDLALGLDLTSRPMFDFGPTTLNAPLPINNSQWTRVAWRYDKKTNRHSIFINGTSVLNTTSYQYDYAGLADQLALISHPGDADWGHFDGQVDELEIFPFALSDEYLATEGRGGLVFHYRFDRTDVDPGHNWVDDSSYNNPMTCGNLDGVGTVCPDDATANEGFIDGGHFFGANEQTDLLVVGPATNLDLSRGDGSFSLAAWIGPIPPDSGRVLMGQSTSGNGDRYPFIDLQQSGTTVGFTDNSNNCVIIADHTPIAYTEKWQHLVATFDGTDLSVYLDSQLVDTTNCAGLKPPNIDNFYIGHSEPAVDSAPLGQGFAGPVDELRIYNYALSPALITDLYYSDNHQIDIRFDEPPGRTEVRDRSLSNITATCTVGACPVTGVPGRLNQSAIFDGINDRLSLAGTNVLGLEDKSFTVSAWVNTNTNTNAPVLGAYSATGTERLYLGVLNQRPYFRLGNTTLTHSTLLDNNRWYFITWRYTYDAGFNTGSQAISINGNTYQTLGNNTPLAGVTPVYIGNYNTNFFSGMLDQVQIFRDALSDAQTQTIYKQAPVVNIHFDEPINQTLFANTNTTMDAYCLTTATCPNSGTKGRVYQGVTFDGVDDYLRIDADSDLITPQYSVGFWVKPHQERGRRQILAMKGTIGFEYQLSINPNSSTLHYALCSGLGSSGGDAGELILDYWNHVMLTFDGQNATIYLNGSVVAEDTDIGCTYGATPLRIGEDIGANYDPFAGEIDEFVFYRSVLSPETIADMVAYQGAWLDARYAHAITIDAVPPTVALDVATNYLPNSNRILSILATDVDSAVASVEYNVNNAGWLPAVQDNDAWLFNFMPSGAGTYQIQVRATDTVGNIGSNSHNVVVDNAGPIIGTLNVEGVAAVPVNRNPERDSWDVALSTVVTAVDAPLNIVRTNIVDSDALSLSGWHTSIYTNTTSGTPSTDYTYNYPFPLPPNGTYTLTIQAIDNIGNMNQRVIPITIDGTPPIAEVTNTGPLANNINGNALIQGTVNDVGTVQSGINNVEISFHPLGHNGQSPVLFLNEKNVLHLPLDDNPIRLTHFQDLSPNNTHATCTFCPTAGQPGYHSTAPLFDGTSQYLLVEDFDFNGQAISFGAWVYPQATIRDWNTILSFATQPNSTYQQALFYQQSSQRFIYTDQDSTTVTSNTFPLDQWYHLWVTIDTANNGTIYVNGQAEATFTTSDLPTAATELAIGKAWDGEGDNTLRYWGGKIDDVAIFSTALSAADINHHFRGFAPVFHLGLNQPNLTSGQTIIDQSRYANTTSFTTNPASPNTIYAQPGIVGAGAYDFNDGHITAPPRAHFDLSAGHFTQIAWVYPHTITSTQPLPIIATPLTTTIPLTAAYPSLAITNSQIIVSFGDGTTYQTFTSSNLLTPNQWQQIAVTFDGTTYKIYLNGELRDSTNLFAGLTPYPTTTFNIGYASPDIATNIYFDGYLDEIAIYRQALSPQYINALYHQGWQPVTMDATGNTIPTTDWHYPTPHNLTGAYQIQLRTNDMNNNQSFGDWDNKRWEGFALTPTTSDGPGGVGATTGQTHLNVWLQADEGLTGAAVAIWPDQSGYNHHALQPTSNNQPTNPTNQLNGLPVVRFDGADDYLSLASIPNLDTESQTIFVVGDYLRTSGTDVMVRSHYDLPDMPNFNRENLVGLFNGSTGLQEGHARSDTGAYHGVSVAHTAGPNIHALSWGLAHFVDYERNGLYLGSATQANAPPRSHVETRLGDSPSAAAPLQGDIAELIIFSTRLNKAQRTLVNNYLSAKYDIPLTPATDFYAGDTTAQGDYDYDVFGLGRAIDGSHLSAQGAGLSLHAAAWELQQDEYLLAGHNSLTNTTVTTDLPANLSARWQRVWYLDKTGTMTATIAFDIGANLAPPTYQLLYRSTTTGTFTNLALTGQIIGSQVHFYVPNNLLVDGYYTLGLIASPNVTIINPPLTWTDTGLGCNWDLHRSPTPYFTPISGTLVTTLPNNTTSYDLTPYFIDTTEPDFLIIHPTNCPSPDSDEIGIYHFNIVAGTP